MQNIIYFFVVFFACSFGSVSGIGGGIIIKPIMDAMGGVSVGTINALSSITVLTMTIVSIIKSRKNAKNIEWKIVAFFAFGSVLGGIFGNKMLAAFLAGTTNDAIVTIVQSILQILIVALVILNEFFKSRMPRFHIKNPILMMMIGIGLGIIAAFLSIGGGLFNKPLLVILLSLSTKSAVYTSLCVIFCAQTSNVVTMGVTNHFALVDFHILPFMMVGAVLGGYAGSYIATHVNDKYFDRLFLITLFIILGLNTFNLLRYIA